MQTGTIRGLVQSWRQRTGTYYRDPKSYWNTRHCAHRDSLQGPGCLGLDETANLGDYTAKWERVRRVLEGEVERGARRLLDAGCGTGWFTQRAATLGFGEIDAADFSSAAAEIAQRNAPTGRVRVAALDEITSTEPYDVVMCIDVLFHVVDDAVWTRSVENLASLTGTNGALVIQDALDETAGSQPARHVRFRSRSTYLRALPDWELDAHHIYVLPNEAMRKDLMVFRRNVRR